MRASTSVHLVCLISSLAMLALAACGPTVSATPTDTAKAPEAAADTDVPTPTVSNSTEEAGAYPLSEPGPYHVGKRTLSLKDPSRGDRLVPITVWYPALRPEGSRIGVPTRDAAPDLSGAPYPLLLSSTKVASQFAPYVISHGFAWASVDGIDTYLQMTKQMYNQPLDILFALEQVSSTPPVGLEAVIDSERAGAIGYSFDGYNALALSGARIDPAYFLAQCPEASPTVAPLVSELSSFNCIPARDWDEFAAGAGELITDSEDGLWQPMTDERIRAVMPLACEGWWLFGEKGLAAVDRPTLMIVATQDELYPENALIFEHLGAPEKALISFVGLDHMMIYDEEPVARMAHFAVAFFALHLQGREDLARYFSQDFVSQHQDLAWGVYEEK